MPCYAPLRGYYSRKRTPHGKRSVVFSVREGFVDRRVTVPCGRCIGCRLEYSRQWAMRCMHEASLHDENCFLTLTYSPEYLPENGSLRKADFQKFMKRLRARYDRDSIRYFHSGEYGSATNRPHYHALLFGFDFADKNYWTQRKGFPVFRSDVLEKLWPFGQSEIGSVTFESSAYVSRYILKKFKGSEDEVRKYYGRREPEYCTMSRRPGIGREWYEKYKDELHLHDSVIVGGREFKPARYYDAAFKDVSPREFAAIRGARKRARNEEEETDERLEARCKVAEARVKLFASEEL